MKPKAKTKAVSTKGGGKAVTSKKASNKPMASLKKGGSKKGC